MRSVIRSGVCFSVLLITACASPVAKKVQTAASEVAIPPPAISQAPPVTEPSIVEDKPEEEAAAPILAEPVPPRATLNSYLELLRRRSCPSPIRRQSPETIPLKATPVPLQTLNPLRKKIGELTFVAGFHLTSSSERFGGLSGLDIVEDGNLLAVSDQGDFVWIDLAKDGVTPIVARIASMRDESGGLLRAKSEGDAEGLAVNDGLALVSFERNHRVLAFDLAACGGAARGAAITTGGYGAPLAQAFAAAKLNVGGNSGPEPLGVTRDWFLLTGLETKAGEASPLSVRPLEAQPDFSIRIGSGLPEFVGLDVVETDGGDIRAFSLHRARNALSSDVIAIAETRLQRSANPSHDGSAEIEERSRIRFVETGSRRLASMSLLSTIDNFEGIAAKEMPDGRVRLYLISDNNCSASQRTLLMVFDFESSPG